jgi:hypothetical protein
MASMKIIVIEISAEMKRMLRAARKTRAAAARMAWQKRQTASEKQNGVWRAAAAHRGVAWR